MICHRIADPFAPIPMRPSRKEDPFNINTVYLIVFLWMTLGTLRIVGPRDLRIG